MNIYDFRVILLACAFLSACGGSSSPTPAPEPPPPVDPDPVASRSFYMGFTPWPYDATLDAINITYQNIQQDGDIIHHQMMQGIPWDEAFNGDPYPAAVEADLTMRDNQTVSGMAVLLSVDSLDAGREGLANNWGNGGEQPRTDPWDVRDFDSPEVITAYSNFALDLIARFNPAYFNFGTEASELILNDLALYEKFVVFAQQVSANIKAVYPELKLLVSVAIKSPASPEMALIKENIADILPYIDVLGISVYPYIFYSHADKGNPATLPADWLSQAISLAPGKALGITETGWIAEDLVIDFFSVNVSSNEVYQQEYVTLLLDESNQLSLEFVVWWSAVDFQALWEGVLAEDDVAAIWRDIGLYDEAVQPRSGLPDWQQYLSRPRQ